MVTEHRPAHQRHLFLPRSHIPDRQHAAGKCHQPTPHSGPNYHCVCVCACAWPQCGGSEPVLSQSDIGLVDLSTGLVQPGRAEGSLPGSSSSRTSSLTGEQRSADGIWCSATFRHQLCCSLSATVAFLKAVTHTTHTCSPSNNVLVWSSQWVLQSSSRQNLFNERFI